MAESLHEQIERERKTANPDPTKLKIYRRYAEGDHDKNLTPEQKTALGSLAKHDYADNLADLVIATWASRLMLTGFAVEDDAVQAFLSDLFVHAQLDDLSYDVNYATARDGNHALILRWLDTPNFGAPADPTAETGEATFGQGRITVHQEDWWDGERGVWIAYDDRGRPAYAVKDFEAWVDVSGNPKPVKRDRRTVYFPDRIERYIKDGQGWAPYPLPGDPESDRPGVVPWTKRNGDPLGIPVVHFKFPRYGLRRYGSSELAGGFVGNQDHVNAFQYGLAMAGTLLAYQILTASGAEWATTPILIPGLMLSSSKPDAKFGSIPAGDLSQLTGGLEGKVQTIARNTQTPIHILQGGDWPSGVALVQAEKGLIAKVLRLAKSIGPSWQAVAHQATEIANAFGAESLNEDAHITARFADPEQLDQLAQAEVDKLKAEALAAIELLQDEESLVALGIPPNEARARLKRREEKAQQEAERIAGIAARSDLGQDERGNEAA